MKLDIGCGKSKKAGYVGVDILSFPGVDVIHDLNIFPYPFQDNSVDEIWMDQVLEHLENPIKIVEELYRICKNSATIIIGVPYFRSFYSVIDPTHRNFFGVFWFDYFDPGKEFFSKYNYTHAKLNIDKIEFNREFKNRRLNFLGKLMVNLAEKYPHFYESRISHLYPMHSLTFYLSVIK